jgi:ElaB/YqjD/DUF883 family membrane-anchored ribosome-binding protein
MNLRLTLCAASALSAFAGTATAQTPADYLACETRLQYADGSAIDPRALRVGGTLAHPELPGVPYAIRTGTIPKQACETYVPVLARISASKDETTHWREKAEGLEDSGRTNAQIVAQINEDPVRQRPYVAMGLGYAAGVVSGALALLGLLLLWKHVLNALGRLGGMVLKRRSGRKGDCPTSARGLVNW